MIILGLVIVLLLMIPMLAIFLDSDVGCALAQRLEPRRAPAPEQRVAALEEEMEYVSEAIRSLQARQRGETAEGEG